ncbi:MAG: hypothetical protein NC548_38340 [Lachnospiraceae bacterium]|nr:hypothetical protein [Lachnospiraceae bacterium]
MERQRMKLLFDEVEDLLSCSPSEEDCTDEENEVYSELANLQNALVNAGIDTVPNQHYYEHVHYNHIAQEEQITRIIAHDKGEAITAAFVAENGRLPKNYGELYAMDNGVYEVKPSDYDSLPAIISQSIRTTAEFDEYDKAILKDLEKAGLLTEDVALVTAKEDPTTVCCIHILTEQVIDKLEEMADDGEYYPEEE